jgi:hypothetical protein
MFRDKEHKNLNGKGLRMKKCENRQPTLQDFHTLAFLAIAPFSLS